MVLAPDGTYKIISRGNEYVFDAKTGDVTGWEKSLEEAIVNVYPLFEDETYYTKTKID